MNNAERHIVSRIKWELNFDQKDQAPSLQSDLSSWTKVDMLKEMHLIFEKLCPPGQTWSIEELELDLGHINLSDLKNDLPLRFRNALLAKLQELAYKSVNGEGGMKVSDIAVSQLQLLEKYLEMGYMPWNRTGANSVNELFAEQFVQNRQALVRMMKRVGRSRDVRRRIAWQFNEISIHKLVRELEPNNHAQIIEFTEEFTKIREKEAFVQSSVPEFKKNLWFWVLNHLFTERGTLFNRLDFMDSSINQMARHYNLSYEELFSEIEQAVEKIGGNAGIKPEFIQALELLSRRNKKAKSKEVESVASQDVYFGYLKLFLNEPNTKDGFPERINIDELILNLYEKDRGAFFEIIAKIDLDRSGWKKVLSMLESKSMAVIVASLSRSHEALVQQALTILNYFKPKGKGGFGPNFWELITISHLSQITSTSFSKTDFVDHLIDELKEEHQKETFFIRLNNTKSTVLLERGVEVSTYLLFKERLGQALSDKRITTEKRLEQAVCRLFGKHKMSSSWASKMTKNEAVTIIKYWVDSNPARLYHILLSQEKSADSFHVILKLLGAHGIKQILKSVSDERAEVLLTFYEAVKDAVRTMANKGNVDPEKFLENTFSHLVINQGGSTVMAFLNEVLKETKSLVSRLEEAKCQEFMDLVLTHSRVRLLNLPQTFVKQLEKDKELPELFLNPKKLDSKTIREVTEWLEVQLRTNKNWITSLTIAEGQVILNKLFGNTYRLERFMSATQRKYESVETASRLKARLHFILWNCASKSTLHKGDISKLMDMVKKTLIRVYEKERIEIEKKESAKVKKANAPMLAKISVFRELLAKLSSGQETKREFETAFETLLIKHPKVLRKELSEIQVSNELIVLLAEIIDVELVVAHVFGSASRLNFEIRTTFDLLFKLMQQVGTVKLRAEMNIRFWSLVVELIKQPSSAKNKLEKELGKVVSELSLNEELTAHELFQILQKESKEYPDYIKKSLIQMNAAFKQVLEPEKEKIEENLKSENLNLTKETEVREVVKAVLNKKDIPYWIESVQKYSINEVLEQLVSTLPFEFYKVLQESKWMDNSLENLLVHVEFKQWIRTAKTTYPNKSSQLDLFNELFYAVGNMTFKGVRQEEVQKILFIRFIKAWKNNHWRIIDPRNVWNEIAWDLRTKLGVEESVFLTGLKQMKELIPPAYRFSLAAMLEAREPRKSHRRIENLSEIQAIKMANVEPNKPQLLEEGVAITNAGLVIVNSYVRTLFERLGLLESGQFKSTQDQEKAVHYLQFIVNGLTTNEEHHLVLNKVMCGMRPTAPVNSGITLNEGEKELIDGMIEAIISYWPAIGNCSVNGFRGNWLIRDGMLSEDEDRWNLTVEKRAYDILINQSPFSFSIMKYPWMEKPIHVNWAY